MGGGGVFLSIRYVLLVKIFLLINLHFKCIIHELIDNVLESAD